MKGNARCIASPESRTPRIQNAALIADAVMPGATHFLNSQRMLIVACHDAQQGPWASIVFGRAGFVSAHDDGQSVMIDRAMAFATDSDILWANLQVDAPLGLLAIELWTRRRLRISGRTEIFTKERLVLHVEQAYPNCPKYIQPASTGRYWDLIVRDWRSAELPVWADWEFIDYSPYNPTLIDS